MYTGKQLRLKRVELDKRAVELAKHLGISKSYISKMENEIQSIPGHFYKKWTDYLGLN